jgi:hypothetical protein
MKDFSKKAQLGKKIPTKKLIKQIDKACSDAILSIDGNHPWDNPPCKGFICNNHLIRRGLFKVRFHPLNCFAGTSGSNFRHENDPQYMTAWYMNKFSKKIYLELQKYSVGEAKWSRDELEQLLYFWETVSGLSPAPDRKYVTAMYMNKFRSIEQVELINAFNEWNQKKKQ